MATKYKKWIAAKKASKKMFTEKEAKRKLMLFAENVIYGNPKAALFLNTYLCKIPDQYIRVVCLDTILGYVVCSEEERQEDLKKHCPGTIAYELITIAIAVRGILGLDRLDEAINN